MNLFIRRNCLACSAIGGFTCLFSKWNSPAKKGGFEVTLKCSFLKQIYSVIIKFWLSRNFTKKLFKRESIIKIPIKMYKILKQKHVLNKRIRKHHNMPVYSGFISSFLSCSLEYWEHSSFLRILPTVQGQQIKLITHKLEKRCLLRNEQHLHYDYIQVYQICID